MEHELEKKIINQFLISLDNCPICYSAFNEDNTWFLSCNCKIAFHQECIFQSLRRTGYICSQCRKKVDNILYRVKPNCLTPNEYQKIHDNNWKTDNIVDKLKYLYLWKVLVGFDKLNKYNYSFKSPISFYNEIYSSQINEGTDGSILTDILVRYKLASNKMLINSTEKAIGEPIFATKEEFWKEKLPALFGPNHQDFLKDINFDSGVIICGGSIFKAMSAYFSAEDLKNDNTDLDFFIYGKTTADRWQAMYGLMNHFKEKYQNRVFFHHIGCVINVHIQGFPRKIQVIYGNFEGIDEIFHHFDYYHIRVGFNGKDVLACPEAILAQMGRIAVVDKYKIKFNVNRVNKIKGLPYEIISFNKMIPLLLYIKEQTEKQEDIFLPDDLIKEGAIIRLATYYSIPPNKILTNVEDIFQAFDQNADMKRETNGYDNNNNPVEYPKLNVLNNYHFDPKFIPQIFRFVSFQDERIDKIGRIVIPQLKLRFELTKIGTIRRSLLKVNILDWRLFKRNSYFYQCHFLDELSASALDTLKRIEAEVIKKTEKNNIQLTSFFFYPAEKRIDNLPPVSHNKSVVIIPEFIQEIPNENTIIIIYIIDQVIM